MSKTQALLSIDLDAAAPEVLQYLKTVPEGIGTRAFFRGNEFLNAHVDRLLFELLQELAERPDLTGCRVVELAARWNTPPMRTRCLRWVETKLVQAGFLALDPWGGWSVVREPAESAAEVREWVLTELPSLAPGLDLSEVGARALPAFLRGEARGFELLFAPTTMPFWQRYFHNDNMVYSANNRLAAYLAERHLSEARGQQWLELGGGLGSAAQMLLQRLPDQIDCYRFSEPFPFFLASARRALLDAFPAQQLRFLGVDLNLDLEPQGVAAASLDVIAAVNVLHIARNLPAALGRLRRALRPGGHLLFIECVRPAPGVAIYVDLPFQILDEFASIEAAGPARPHGGFLTSAQWQRCLREAGFALVEEVPVHREALQHYPNLFVAGYLARA